MQRKLLVDQNYVLGMAILLSDIDHLENIQPSIIGTLYLIWRASCVKNTPN